MKRLPIVIAILIAGVFLAFNTTGKSKTPPGKYEKIVQIVGEYLKQGHFSPKIIDDEFSKKVYTKYFEDLDPDKDMFLQQDLTALNQFSTKIDDEINGNTSVQFFLEAGKIFNKRVEEASVLYKDILSRPFDFTTNESIVTDNKKLNFPSSDAERKDVWRKRLKYLTLQRYVDLIDSREKNKGKEGALNKTDAELEKEARQKISVAMDRTFERYRTKFNIEEKFSVFVNTITSMFDPYTEYMLPLDKRYFDETLSGTFDGIGAQLGSEDGNIKIVSIIPGGPANKNGQLEIGDLIVRIAQGSDTPVEVAGFTIEDAVKLIRGKKGTEVQLTVRKKDGSLKTISLIRAKIVQDESYVRSAVINQGTSKIGYIFLPEFYANFNDPTDPHRSALDVTNEVKKLKEEKVDGIVLDLRNNGGGSLNDVVQMAGLFVDRGPIVQVKGRGRNPEVLKDNDGGILWDGPLTVMVNELSASASEIFAAAMQDYGRAVIMGSTSTYGKGSVQRSIGLDPNDFMSQTSDLGSLKLTIQKFYRISGGSTQLKGVVPDVIVPDYYEYLKIRERDNPNALPYDEIVRANYNMWQPGFNYQTVEQYAKTRVSNDSVFRLIKQETNVLAKQNDKEYPLEINAFRKDQKITRDAVKKIQTLIKSDKALQVSFMAADKNRYESADKDKTERYKQWLTGVSKDVYIDQAVKVINDMVFQQNLVKAKGAAF